MTDAVAVPLTREQQDFRRAVREFADRVAGPAAAERGPGQDPHVDVVRRAAELGLFGLPFPSAHGGLDADAATFCLSLEELARVDVPLAELLIRSSAEAANAVARAGSEAQKARWLAPMARGHVLATIVQAGAMTARERDDGWVLEGPPDALERVGSRLARLRVVVAGTGGGGASLFVVPLDRPSEILPSEALLGGLGGAGPILRAVAPDAWLAHTAVAVGIARDRPAAADRVRDAYLAGCRLRDRGRPYRVEAARALEMALDLRIQGSEPS